MAEGVVADLNPMHWPLAFPDVRDAGGFDLVLGNPPWEQYKGEETPFFAQSAPQIAAMTSEHRGKAIEALAESDDPAEAALHDKWKHYKALQDRLAHYAKTSGRFTRTPNEANTYVLFTEAAAQASTHVGLIVKSGIAIDQSQSSVWQTLLDSRRVVEIRDIVNGSRGGANLVFPDVASVERFCVLVLGPPTAGELRAGMLNFGVDAAVECDPWVWTNDAIRTVAPRTRTLLSTSSHEDIRLVLELHERFPTLDFADEDGANAWGLDHHALFHSSGARKAGLLHRGENLLATGFTLMPDRTMRHPDGRVEVPVYEGQMANRWDHRARTYEGYNSTSKYGRKPYIPWTSDEQHADTTYEVEPRYWMSESVHEARLADILGETDRTLLAMRDIGAVWRNRRSMRVALLGRRPATDTLPVLSVPTSNALAATALLNSMTFDFLVRSRMPGAHVKPWMVSQCAAPAVSDIDSTVVALAEELSITSQTLADELSLPVHPWDAARRARLDAAVDARIARIYGMSRDNYELILDHFVVLRKMEETDERIGEYRSRRLRLEAFEELEG